MKSRVECYRIVNIITVLIKTRGEPSKACRRPKEQNYTTGLNPGSVEYADARNVFISTHVRHMQ